MSTKANSGSINMIGFYYIIFSLIKNILRHLCHLYKHKNTINVNYEDKYHRQSIKYKEKVSVPCLLANCTNDWVLTRLKARLKTINIF